jgi:hypothetical protein
MDFAPLIVIVRHCERSEAIHGVAMEESIASLRTQ